MDYNYEIQELVDLLVSSSLSCDEKMEKFKIQKESLRQNLIASLIKNNYSTKAVKNLLAHELIDVSNDQFKLICKNSVTIESTSNNKTILEKSDLSKYVTKKQFFKIMVLLMLIELLFICVLIVAFLYIYIV